jgi:hypothetical protein
MFASQVGLNSSLIYNIEEVDGNARLFYKNADGTVLNIIDTAEVVGDILLGMNAVNTDDVVMISVYDTNGNLVLIPYSSFLMVSEVNDGGSIITYVNGTTIANARVNNSVASVVGMFNAAVGQYDSGQITIDTTTAPNANYFVSAYDNTFKSTMISYNSQNTYDSLNRPSIFYGVYNSVWFRPSIPWTAVTKVTVYTNVTAAAPTPNQFTLAYGYSEEYYEPGTTNLLQEGVLGAGQLGNPVYNPVNQLLPGVPPTTPYTPNAGDAGTRWGEVIYTSYPGYINTYTTGFVGLEFQGTGTYNIPDPTLADYYKSSMISFQFKTLNSDPNLKFRFVIDYI